LQDFRNLLKGLSNMTPRTRRPTAPVLPFIADSGRIRMGDCMRIAASPIPGKIPASVADNGRIRFGDCMRARFSGTNR
jgi:hypothetical protein